MKKRIFVIAMATVILFSLSACNANSASAAGSAGINTANRINTTLTSLESLSDRDFNFPAALGEDYYQDAESAEKYTARNNYNSFYKKVDDLYVLCADVRATNEKCKEVCAKIKSETAQLKKLSKELKKDNNNKQDKKRYALLNSINKEVVKADNELRKDRGRVRNRLKGLPKGDVTSIDVEKTTMRYMMVMNKVETRLKLLENTLAELEKMNAEARALLGIDSEKINNEKKDENIDESIPTQAFLRRQNPHNQQKQQGPQEQQERVDKHIVKTMPHRFIRDKERTERQAASRDNLYTWQAFQPEN